MLISSMLIGMALQPDPTRAPREAYARCLSQFLQASVTARKAADAFAAELPQQCTNEATAYREAIIRRDTASRISRAVAEQNANEEVEYSRENARESFADATTPR